MGHTGNNLTKDSGDADSTQLSPNDAALLSRYLDGDLGKAQRENLEKRLASDAPLRQEAEALRAMQTALRAMPLTTDAGSAQDRVFTRLERAVRLDAARPQSSSNHFFGRGRMLAAGLAVATVAGVVFLIPGSNFTPAVPDSPAVQATQPGTRVPLPEADEMETLARLHDAQNVTVNAAPTGEVL